MGPEFGFITPEKALIWLSRVVTTHMTTRGTAEAFQQIHRIRESLPDEPLEFISKSTEEVRRNTWRQLSPAQLLAEADAGSAFFESVGRGFESLRAQHIY